jgi:hypothetical protein
MVALITRPSGKIHVTFIGLSFRNAAQVAAGLPAARVFLAR